jgi:hypothetical protein
VPGRRGADLRREQPTAKITGPGGDPKANAQPGGGAAGAFALDEAFPKQTLDKLRQLRVTLEQAARPSACARAAL